MNLHFGTGLGQDAKNVREILAILYNEKGSDSHHLLHDKTPFRGVFLVAEQVMPTLGARFARRDGQN